MAFNLTNADSALKEDYQPAVRDQINQTNMLLMQVEKNTTDFEGRRAVLSLHVNRNSGVGARAEGAALPTAGSQGYAEERVPCKYLYGTLEITGPTIRAMQSDKASFVRAVDSETKGIVNDLKKDVNRQLFADGSGKIATCGTTTGATLVVLAAATTAVQMRQFEINMKVDIGTAGSHASVVSGATISAVDTTNKTITIDSSVTTSASHFVFRNGVGATDELTGLAKIVSATGALFNVDPATQPRWASYDNNNSGSNRSITENLVETVLDEVSIRSAEQPDLIVTSHGVRRAYSNLLTSLKRFSDTNALVLKGGFKALSISAGDSEVALVVDRDAPLNKLYFLNTKHLTEYVQSDWEFMEEDGAVLSRKAGYDAYQAVLFKYAEFATDNRQAHGSLSDITEA